MVADQQKRFAERTKSRALDVLLSQSGALRQNIGDQAARELLREGLVADILDTAWRYQFDDDRSECKRKIQELVHIAIEEREVEAEGAAEES